MNKKNILKIAAPILIICVAAAIWAGKNLFFEKTPVWQDNPDFELHVKEPPIDLERLKKYKVPIILDFGAYDCLPCKEMIKAMEELVADELRGRAIIKFADIWRRQDLARGYPIKTIPTLYFYDSTGKPFKPKDPKAFNMNLVYDEESKEHIATIHEGVLSRQEIIDILVEMGMKQ